MITGIPSGAAAAAPNGHSLTSKPKRSPASILDKNALSVLKGLVDRIVIRGEASEKEYKEASDRWNTAFLKSPHIVAFPKDENQVSSLLKFVSEHKLDVSVAGGRHSYHGASCVQDGLTIDLADIRYAKYDAATQTVVAGGGSLAGDVEVEADKHGRYAVFGAVAKTGMGIATGGGVGFLSGEHGLVIDNVLAARVVTANGDIVVANEKENSDLYWGIRGGGNNFGIITEFTFKTHAQRVPGGMIFMGMYFFQPDRYKELLAIQSALYDDAVVASKGRFCSLLMHSQAFDDNGQMAAFMTVFNGTEEEALPYLQPILDAKPVGQMAGPKKYTELTKMLGEMPDGGFNRKFTSSALFDHPFDVAALEPAFDEYLAFREKYGAAVRKSLFVVEARDSQAVVTTEPTATAYHNRAARRSAVISEPIWADAGLDDEIKREFGKIQKTLRAGIQAQAAGKANGAANGQPARDWDAVLPTIGNGDRSAATIFGPNLPRMRQLKREFDPESVFDKWFYVAPADA